MSEVTINASKRKTSFISVLTWKKCNTTSKTSSFSTQSIKQKIFFIFYFFFQPNCILDRLPNPTAFILGRLPTGLKIPNAQDKSRTIISSK